MGQRLASYRPIALTSSITNPLKQTMIVRIAECVMPHVTANQGGHLQGMGSEQQLWSLVERMEIDYQNENDLCMCATDVHKAFDQVYWKGTGDHAMNGKFLDHEQHGDSELEGHHCSWPQSLFNG